MLAGDTGDQVFIAAAGQTGSERMSLQIDGNTVKTWVNVGGNIANREFLGFTYTATGTVDPKSVRVVFDNDLYSPGSIDRNLIVDYVRIGGVQFDPESPSTFSTGTWRQGFGVLPGYTESEWLHTNGYLEFSDEPAQYGSTIVIKAAGQTGAETMQLVVAGQVKQTWTNVGGNAATGQFDTFHYRGDETAIGSDLEIRFTNNEIGPGTPDRNLRVDYVVVDDQLVQTEAPSTYSTGTWKPVDGIQPGYRQSEFLHVNGSFLYERSIANAGAVSLATSNYTVNEGDGSVQIQLRRTGGSDGEITVAYQTFASTATTGQDFVNTAGVVTFSDRQTTRTVNIPIINDTLNDEFDEQFTFTIDNPTGGATLLAPRTATITILDNDGTSQPLPNYNNFASTTGLKLNGNSTRSEDRLQLTDTGQNRRGSAFFTTPIELDYGDSFRTQFSFTMSGGQGTAGADGLALVLHRSAAGSDALGESGDGMGYSGISESIAIEFDTYEGSNDINSNHIAISLNGQTFNTWSSTGASFDLNSGATYYAWVDYNGDSSKLAVYLSDAPTKPSGALLVSLLDVPFFGGDYQNAGRKTYFGFTAGTGEFTNRHQVLSWNLDTGTPPADPPLLQTGNVNAVTIASGLNLPTAMDWINGIASPVTLIAEKGGVVKSMIGGVVQSTPFIDISNIVNEAGDRGLIDIAVHPDFVNNPYVYLYYTYDPPQTQTYVNDPFAGPDRPGNRAARLVRVTADATTGYRTAVADSEVVLLGENSTWANFNGFVNSTIDIDEPAAGVFVDGTNLNDFLNSDSESHSAGGLAFAPDGTLFVSVGDGASYNRVDPRAVRVQDIDNLSGKILRIDPITGNGVILNPFYNNDPTANRSKVYQYGLRNPFRLTVDDATGRLFIGEVGWSDWEEINTGEPGANFGWPYYQGGNGTSVVNTEYATLPEAQAFYASGQAVVAPAFGLSHSIDGINSIVVGDMITTNRYGTELNGSVIFNDLGQGIVRSASFTASGSLLGVSSFATAANVVVQINEGADGYLYFVDLDDGVIGRWEPV